MKKYIAVVFGIFPLLIFGQDFQAKVYDSLSKNPIPFATITTNFGQNTVTNEEGLFRLNKIEKFTATDSIFISCMGFTSFGESILTIPESTIYLPEKSIELEGVILAQKELTAEEIIEKASEGFREKYELTLTQKDFFMRESYTQRWDRREMNIKKSSIAEFNQRFWDSILTTIPKQDSWHTESAGSLYNDWTEEKQKLNLIRAVELADTINEKGYDQLEGKITKVLDKYVKPTSYFKFKSGIFSTKIDRDEIIERKQDSLSDLSEKNDDSPAKKTPAETFHENRKKNLHSIASFMNIKDDKLDFDILKHASRYRFELIDFTYLDDTPVYVINFTPERKKANNSGTVYIDADRFAVIQLEQEKTQNLFNFSLFGISIQYRQRTAQIKFNRFESEKYQPQYIETITKYNTGIKRPIKMVEKNKVVKGRRKQNELVGNIHMKLSYEEKKTLLIHHSKPLKESAFSALKTQKTFSPEKRNNFDPRFWEGYTIVEPNQGVRSFRTTQNQ